MLATITPEAFQDPRSWRKLVAIVRVRPCGDLLPVRGKYGGRINTIGPSGLTCDPALRCSLADMVAAVTLTGKVTQVEEAIILEPGPPQAGLKSKNYFGEAGLGVDPYRTDAFKWLIDLRDKTKEVHDPIENPLKTIANSTGYRIFAEMIRDDAPKPERLRVWNHEGELSELETTALEQPGTHFDPILATLITSAARLKLALVESLVIG